MLDLSYCKRGIAGPGSNMPSQLQARLEFEVLNCP